MDKLTILECANQLLDIMRTKHYGEASIKQYEKYFTDFFIYSKSLGKDYFEEEVAIKYANSITGFELKNLAEDRNDTKKYIVVLRALRILGEYSRDRIFVPRFSRFHDPVKDNTYWTPIYNSFLLYLKTDCDYKDSTINHKELAIRKMINILIDLNVNSLNDVDASIIETIVASFIHESPKSVTHNLGDLKQFFQHCFDNSLCKNNIIQFFPIIKTPHETKIPTSFTVEETQQLLDSIDREDPKGKRDYAIILIASHLGLRAVDIKNIKLSDFDWQKKVLTITQEKTRHTITLPILNDVGWSIIDYIKNGRPQVDCNYLFIRHNSPYDGFFSSSGISAIFTKRIHEAGLNINRDKKCGVHSLRHTLSVALLEKEIPLPIISQILGHQSIKSTETYLKINIQGLKECPMDPERVFDDEL